ncbi:MAG: BamA/TamA family outer membrane protein, partial [Balneolaceae bacterium]
PLDENRNLVGGRVYSKYSFEVRYPAVSSEQIQLIPYLFFDAGNAFNDLSEFDPFNIKRATGLGARIFLPILGLVDLSYGYRFDGTPASNEGAGLKAGEWEFLFNIGAPF